MARPASFESMVGASRPMRKVYRQVERVARLDVPVLITGESGTGKELVAHAIHRRSRRASQPFIPIHTGAIVPELIASELFGHEKGAFTGATSQKRGTFELADGGTLFLDEISTMDQKTQVSLLRVLETGRFQRVGGSKEVSSDVRVVAATNEDLRKAIKEGRFREDLYHRINVFNIRLPPLRKRGADIELLAQSFMERYAEELGSEGRQISPDALSLLRAYGWPGNVRELENVIMRTLIMAENESVTADLLPPEVQASKRKSSRISFEVGMSLDDIEREYIRRVLEATDGNKTEAARLLGISRKALYNKMERYGLE